MSIKVFIDAVDRVRVAAENFDKANGYSSGFLVEEERKALVAGINGLDIAMLAVRNADRAKAATPDYKEIAHIFGTALGTALSCARGNGAVRTKQCGQQVDAALREIFKIDVDKPAE